MNRLGGPAGDWTTTMRRLPVQSPDTKTPPDASSNDLDLAQTDLREAAGDRIFFAAGSAQIGTRSRAALARQARYLNDRPGIVVVIDGHADESGPVKAVMALSQARAEAVARLLMDEGVARERITTQAHGTSERVADCSSPACAAQNRRAVTRIVSAPARSTPQSFSTLPPVPRHFGLGGDPKLPERGR
ncbi:MAG: OmpA family protein [Hyphomicrobiaceae bacterium]